MFSTMMKTEFSTKKASPVKRRFPRGSTLLEQKAFCSAHSAVNAGRGHPTFFRPALQEAFIPALPGLFTCQTFSLRSLPGLLVLIIGFPFLFYHFLFRISRFFIAYSDSDIIPSSASAFSFLNCSAGSPSAWVSCSGNVSVMISCSAMPPRFNAKSP